MRLGNKIKRTSMRKHRRSVQLPAAFAVAFSEKVILYLLSRCREGYFFLSMRTTNVAKLIIMTSAS